MHSKTTQISDLFARAHVRTCARADRLALWSEYELKEFLLDKKTTTISHASPKFLLRKSSIFLYLLQIVVKELTCSFLFTRLSISF
jgi:hypothetical protein